MKPENFHKQQKQSVARVKTIIKDKLGWMQGFPVLDGDQLLWHHSQGAFYHDQITAVDAPVIRKSQRAINTLFRDYPKALPKVVGQAEIWFQRHMTYLDAVKAAAKQGHWVNPGLALTQADADFQNITFKSTSIKSLNNELKSMLYWRCFLQRPWLKSMAQALVPWSDSFPRASNMMDVAALCALESRKSPALIDWITYNQGHDCMTQVTAKDYADYLRFNSAKAVKKHQSAFNPKPIKGHLMGAQMTPLLSQLSGLKAAHRSRALDYFRVLNLKEKNAQWFNWYATTEAICDKIRNHIHWADGHNWRELVELRHQVKSQLDNRPADLKIDQILKDVITCASHKNQHNHLLQAVPEFAALSLPQATSEALLSYAAALFTWHQPKPERFKALLSGLHQYLSLPADPNRAAEMPWRNLPTHQWQHLDAKILKQLDAPQIHDFFQVINQIKQADNQSPSQDEVHELLNLFLAGYDVPALVGMYPALSQAKVLEDDFPCSLARFAREKALTSKQIIQLHHRYVELSDYQTDFDGLAFLLGLFGQADQQNQMLDLVLNQNLKGIKSLTQYLRFIQRHSGPAAIQPPQSHAVPADWIRHFPTAFHAIIEHINGLSEQAEQKVTAVFKKTWWTRHMLQQEIQQLSASKDQAQVNQSAIEQRLDKLSSQMAKHRDITPTKANTIQQKLQQLYQQLLFSHWQQTSKQQFKLAWAEFLGIKPDHLGAWLLQGAMIEKFMPINDFNAQSKQLAKQMIQAINQDQFDQFIQAKHNQRFRQLLADQGFDLSTWPDAVAPLKYHTETGEVITLAIEHDPLQLIDMGGHFRTCLSPGNFNYFSVFTNIADVNKQVIYARNAQKQVVGRVLIGITNQGALQVFHCYTHHKKYQFNQQVMGYIKNMAEQLGLLISAHGSVAPLSCQQWYDDGARNIHSHYPGLAENARFRRQLPTMEASAFMDELKAAIGPRHINALVFTSLLSMPEFKANPQLITPLLKLSTTVDHIPTADLWQLYALSQSADLQKSCFAAHRKRLLKQLHQLIHHWEWFENPHIETIASHHPSDALRLLKAMAKTQKINWRTDLKNNFRRAAQVALQQLGRHHLAESMDAS